MLFFGLLGCQKAWNDHYSAEGSSSGIVSPYNLLEYLKSIPDYSTFVSKLEATGLDKELSRDQYLTVWVVNNERMAKLAEMGLDETFVLKYHINNLTYDESKLKEGLRLRTLSGKYLSVSVAGDGNILVGDARIIKGNQLCQNGVVHEIDQLMRPDESIYDYLSGLGDDYSIIRDSIFAMNDTVFDMENSIPTGVDPTGNTIYDSTFVIQNPIFENADFRSEFSQVTLFLPSNYVIKQCFDDLKQLYGQFGKTFLREDTLIAMDWIKNAIFYDQLVENYGSVEDLISASGEIWRTSVQQVDMHYKRMSNGRIYQITHLKIPNNVHIQMIKQLFHYWEYVPDMDKPALFTLSNVTEVTPTNRDHVTFPTLGIELTYRTLLIKGDLIAGQPASIDFTPVMLQKNQDGSTGYKVVEVPPGEYNLYLGFRSKSHPFINVYIDGKQVAKDLNVEPSNPWNYDRSTNTVSGTKYNGWGGLVGPVTIEGDQVRSFRLKIEFAGLGKGSEEAMEPYHWALVPTKNNY